MKDFAKDWNSSKQPRKQRKYRFNAPLHIKGKFLSAHLSKELRQKHKTRSLRVRKGDKVKVMVGQLKGRTGTVEKVSVLHERIYITGIDREKRDGSKSLIPIKPSNLMIQELDLSDKKRLKGENKK